MPAIERNEAAEACWGQGPHPARLPFIRTPRKVPPNSKCCPRQPGRSLVHLSARKAFEPGQTSDFNGAVEPWFISNRKLLAKQT